MLQYLKLIAVLMVWSTDFIFAKFANIYLPPVFSIAVRFTLASLCLLSILLLKGEFVKPDKKQLLILLALGIGVVGLRYPMEYIGLQYTSAINSVIITSLTPVITALISSIVNRTRPSAAHLLLLVVSVAGVSLIALSDGGGLHLNFGDLLIFLGVVLWSIYNVMGKSVMSRLTPLQATFFTCSFSLLLTVPLAAASAGKADIAAVPFTIWLGIAAIGIFGSGIGMYWWYQSIDRLGSARCTLLYNLLPLFTSILAVVILQEALSALKLIGGLLVVLASVAAVFLRDEKKAEAK